MEFTEKEKQIINRILLRPPGKMQILYDYGIYLLPSIVFVIYGIWNKDLIAVVVSYGVLAIIVIIYLSYTREDGKHLYSVIKKRRQS